ncbi:cell surface protein [Brachyspira alvinipulli]|uniref:cell surface protein n=1 Tax=Brachyspira alvinipulli TaxID=84379 RepID=UPI0004B2618B|nr:cell surface protein [Brachyspira alvinipulli]
MIEKVSKKVKFLAAVIGSLLITSVSAFGMYGVDGDDWIDFLTHGNQFRARMDQLGFVLGNGTIKGTFGVMADNGWMGNIFSYNQANATTGGNSPVNNEASSFNPTVSAGIAYTSDMIGVGVGYNFTYINRFIQVHTPTLVLNALNNNLRLAVPIQVAVSDKGNYNNGSVSDGVKYTGVGFNNIELRYYTGIDAFNQIRVYASYKNNTWENVTNSKVVSEEFGLQLRLYFLRTQIGNVTVNPFIRIDYNQALKGELSRSFITVANSYNNLDGVAVGVNQKQSDIYDVSPFRVFVKPVLSLAASSDIISFYFEPSLGYAVASSKRKDQGQETTHALNWGAYAEMYVTPVQDLEWYFEMDVNGNVTGRDNKLANTDLSPVLFETTTGITWYLPSLN